MALRENFESSGNWLFRWRSYFPIVLVIMFLVALIDYQYPGGEEFAHTWELICLVVSLFGLLIRIETIGHTPKGTSGRNTEEGQVAESLNTTGIYATLRNPLYLGNFFMWLGVAMFVGNFLLTIIFVLIFWLYYERIIFAEEAFLINKFGKEYTDWADRTPAFFPKISQYSKADLSFSFKNILRREYNGFYAIFVLMFLFKLVGVYFLTGEVVYDLMWSYLLAGSTVIWFILRGLKKYTKLFHVEGR